MINKRLRKKRKEIRHFWYSYALFFWVGYLYGIIALRDGWKESLFFGVFIWVFVIALIRVSDEYTGRYSSNNKEVSK